MAEQSKKLLTFNEIVGMFLPALARSEGGKIDHTNNKIDSLIRLDDGELYRLSFDKASLNE